MSPAGYTNTCFRPCCECSCSHTCSRSSASEQQPCSSSRLQGVYTISGRVTVRAPSASKAQPPERKQRAAFGEEAGLSMRPVEQAEAPCVHPMDAMTRVIGQFSAPCLRSLSTTAMLATKLSLRAHPSLGNVEGARVFLMSWLHSLRRR